MPPSSYLYRFTEAVGYNNAHRQEYCFAEAVGNGLVLQARRPKIA
jgi:hypothetical protein